MIVTALIQAIKLLFMAVTWLLFWFGLIALVKVYLHLTFRKSLEKKFERSSFCFKDLLSYFNLVVASLSALAKKKKTWCFFEIGKLDYYLSMVATMVGNKKKNYTTRRTLGNAIQGKKYFRAWHYTTHTNDHWEMFFSLININLVGIWNKNK